ncbi:hypothetical protein LV75_004700 [Actinokineospora diospyrosa]|uniref:Uncharacterized protein n=1 Tax=Actinokineospora diospyrosa TaxID=103728 RepID=A0ABT1II13_9PSEU|nr:hypothetical protein [Actinokineospora diospyrosa]
MPPASGRSGQARGGSGTRLPLARTAPRLNLRARTRPQPSQSLATANPLAPPALRRVRPPPRAAQPHNTHALAPPDQPRGHPEAPVPTRPPSGPAPTHPVGRPNTRTQRRQPAPRQVRPNPPDHPAPLGVAGAKPARWGGLVLRGGATPVAFPRGRASLFGPCCADLPRVSQGPRAKQVRPIELVTKIADRDRCRRQATRRPIRLAMPQASRAAPPEPKARSPRPAPRSAQSPPDLAKHPHRPSPPRPAAPSRATPAPTLSGGRPRCQSTGSDLRKQPPQKSVDNSAVVDNSNASGGQPRGLWTTQRRPKRLSSPGPPVPQPQEAPQSDCAADSAR